MLRRLFPHPYLSLTLALCWVLLSNSVSLGTLVLALILATAIPLFAAPGGRAVRGSNGPSPLPPMPRWCCGT